MLHLLRSAVTMQLDTVSEADTASRFTDAHARTTTSEAADSLCAGLQVAVFDTAFHQTMPQRAYEYALPKALADEHKLRRYGAHGTSYKFLTSKAAQVGRVTSHFQIACDAVLLPYIPCNAASRFQAGSGCAEARCRKHRAMTPMMEDELALLPQRAGKHTMSLCGGDTEVSIALRMCADAWQGGQRHQPRRVSSGRGCQCRVHPRRRERGHQHGPHAARRVSCSAMDV